MPIKLIAFDLDGTTLNSKGELSEENRAGIQALAQRGIHTAVCTGRYYGEIPESILSLPEFEYIITSNGAVMYHRDTVIFKQTVSEEALLRAVSILSRFDCLTELYFNGHSYAPREKFPRLLEISRAHGYEEMFIKTRTQVENMQIFAEEHAAEIEKIHSFVLSADEFTAINAALSPLRDALEISASGLNVELTARGVSKGGTLKRLAEQLGIAREDTAAVGDSQNDISMLEYAAHPYCPADAMPEIKAIATALPHAHDDSALPDLLNLI